MSLLQLGSVTVSVRSVGNLRVREAISCVYLRQSWLFLIFHLSVL